MFWGDTHINAIIERFSKEIQEKKPLVIRDEKTLSGRVHVGSLRGFVLHGLLGQILKEKSIPHTFLWEFNDADPMDGLPVYLDKEVYDPHMGKPLASVPSPDDSAKNFAAFFQQEFEEEVLQKLGFSYQGYHLFEAYKKGLFNEVIRLSLEHAEHIRAIYKEVSRSEKPADWLPLNVICESCGKVGTTHVDAFRDETVAYQCLPDQVTWAKGCGHKGNTSPYDGGATLPWKVEWAAKWRVFGVHIEGAGKDHSTAGGSRDVAARISKEIFDYPEPYNLPYEFFIVGGKKMSSSKGEGVSASAIMTILPPELVRLLMIRKDPSKTIDFIPDGRTIPNLYDEYDNLAAHYFNRVAEKNDDFARIYSLIQVDKKIEGAYTMRFTQVVFLIQMPHIDIYDEAEKLKGKKLTTYERELLEERSTYARLWLEHYAPEEHKFILQKALPAAAQDLTKIQKEVLRHIYEKMSQESKMTSEDLHGYLHELKKELDAQPKDIFQPLYRVFLDKTSGPQAGWFLTALPREFVLQRLKEVL